MARKNPPSTRDAQHEKPAEIHLINGETILAPDHDTNNNWCIVYKSATTGIAKKIPREAILYIDRESGDTSINNSSSESNVTDRWHDLPACTCGTDLIETAELDTTFAPAAGARPPAPSMNKVPAATCGKCGKHVGALYGIEIVEAIWEARGEPLPRHEPDDEDEEPRFVTDGGYSLPYLHDTRAAEDVWEKLRIETDDRPTIGAIVTELDGGDM
jgi:hypothetical protein